MRFLSVGLLCAIFAMPAGAAPGTRPVKRAGTTSRVLPASVGAWSASPSQVVLPEALETFSVGDAPILREYGLVAAERAEYQNSGHHLTVTLYRMRDSSSAYGAFTFLRTRDMTASDLAEFSAVNRDRVLAVEGNLLLDAAGSGAASLADLKTLVAGIALAAEMTPYPIMRNYLPTQGLIPNSDHYFLGPAALQRLQPEEFVTPIPNIPLSRNAVTLGDWIGFYDGAEAELATYRLGNVIVRVGDQSLRDVIVTLLLVRYPTRQLATKHLDVLSKRFVVNPASDSPAGPAVGSLQPIFVVRKSALLAIVAGTRSQPVAADLIRKVKYETQITWSEPSWKATEKPFVELLYGVFVGTGVILTYAIVASLAFGLVRLTVKRLLPTRVFDRPSQMDVLQIGIYSKPIESKDFYSGEPPS